MKDKEAIERVIELLNRMTEETRPEPKFNVGQKVNRTNGASGLEICTVEWNNDHWSYLFIAKTFRLPEDALTLARPSPKFKVGDKVVFSGGGQMIVSNVSWRDDHGEPHYHYHSENSIFRTDEEDLHLAPQWVDVTEECEVSFYRHPRGYVLVDITHNAKHVQLLGLNQLEDTLADGYKIEVAETTHLGTEWFRIMRGV